MKNFLLYITAIIFSINVAAQDTPCTATSISTNTGCNTGDNTGATADGYTGSCWLSAESNSVWFEVVAINDTLTFSTDYAGTGLTDTQLAIYSSSDNTCTGTLTEVGCDEDGGTSCGLCSVTTLTSLTVGDTYFIQIDGYGTQVGDFCISVTEPLATAPDFGTSCELAHQLYVDDICYGDVVEGNIGDGNNLTSTNSVDQSCTAEDDSQQNGYWNTFTANDNSTTIDMPDFTGGSTPNIFDISIYTGSCGSLTEIDCRSVPSKDNAYSIATTSGTTYYMFITNGSNYTGEIRRVSVCSSVACTAPTNDACANAISVTDGTIYTGTTACATPDLALCSGTTENNIWYSWTVPSTWTDGDNAFVSLTNQDCYKNDPTTPSSGSQLSVYNADETCATISGGTGECMVFTNPQDDENFYGEFAPTVGSTYMINIDGYGGDACTFDFRVNNKAPVILPIVLSNFDANYNESLDVVEIIWETQSETNNDFFTVEKTKDGQIYEKVATIDGANTSIEVNNYRLIDANPYKGLSYYRLKQTDYDGAFEYSNLISVSVAIDFDDLKFVPNPAESYGVLLFTANSTRHSTVKVYDVSGRVVLLKDIIIEKGNNTITLNLTTFKKGMYFLSIANDKEKANLKFIKE